MTRLTTVLLTIVLALGVAAPTAASSDTTSRAFVNKHRETVLFVGEIDAGSSRDAELVLRVINARMVEESFGGIVLMEDRMPMGRGISDGKAFLAMTRGGDMALIVAIAVGPSVYLGMVAGGHIDGPDGEALGDMMVSVVLDGIDADPPRGYVEVDMSDDNPFGVEGMGL